METLPLEDNEPYILKLKIGNEDYEIDTKYLIHIRGDITEDANSVELEEDLEKISGYLHIISQSYRTASLRTKKYETKFEAWYNQKYVEVEHELTEQFKKEVEAGTRSKTKMQPTQQQIKSAVINKYEDQWMKYNQKMKESKVEEEFLYREFKLLQNRASHIQSILSMRKQIIPTEGVK